MTARQAIWRRVFLIGFLPSRLTPAKLKTVPHAREKGAGGRPGQARETARGRRVSAGSCARRASGGRSEFGLRRAPRARSPAGGSTRRRPRPCLLYTSEAADE